MPKGRLSKFRAFRLSSSSLIFLIKEKETQCLRSLRITRPLTLFAELNDTALYGSQCQALGYAVSI
ncbi:Uncharacterized protein XB16_3061 [Leptospira santarosai]|uniref:Uncharacterized protein n=1 Tax=Leptospira santarosai TaxID=28183 RepID=A0A2P1QWS2_9LEPT|nr:Uncharacterized protein XB16_3061 [Leptospira santarosai]